VSGARLVGVARATLGGFGAVPGTRGRTILAVVAIALGVALGFAVQLINHTALAEFAAGLATLSGDADLQVQGGRSGFDETIYAALARDPAVSVASPVLQLDAALPGRERSLPVLGIDALRAAAVTPALIGDAADATDLLRPDAVFLSAAASTWLGLHRGDVLVAQRGVDTVALRVAGTVPADPRTVVAVMDVAGAQDAFGRPGVLSRIDLRLRPGVDAKATAQRLAAMLPAGVGVSSPRSTLESTERLTRAYRVNLEVLALVALFTGALLVYSTQSLAVQRRRVPFALLRSLGLTRGRLVRLVTMEGALLGVVGALVGLAAGYAIAAAATRWFGLDLGAGFFRGQAPGVSMDWIAAAWFGAAGVVAAALGSYAPARSTCLL
jgi:putative ABC transport system permease protein